MTEDNLIIGLFNQEGVKTALAAFLSYSKYESCTLAQSKDKNPAMSDSVVNMSCLVCLIIYKKGEVCDMVWFYGSVYAAYCFFAVPVATLSHSWCFIRCLKQLSIDVN